MIDNMTEIEVGACSGGGLFEYLVEAAAQAVANYLDSLAGPNV